MRFTPGPVQTTSIYQKSTMMSQRCCPDCLVSLIHFNKSTEISLMIKRSHFYSIRLFDSINILLARGSIRILSLVRLSDCLSITRLDVNKKAQLSLTNSRDAKACRKLLQFDVLTTLSLTILVYFHSFSCCCVRNLRNPEKFSD